MRWAIMRGMKTADVIEFFGTQAAAAKAIGIAQPSIAKWGAYPPDVRQVQIERLTKKKLLAEPGCMIRLMTAPAKLNA